MATRGTGAFPELAKSASNEDIQEYHLSPLPLGSSGLAFLDQLEENQLRNMNIWTKLVSSTLPVARLSKMQICLDPRDPSEALER